MPEHQIGERSNRFDDLAESLRVDPSRSQILVEVDTETCTLKKALAILEDLQIQQVRYEVLEKGDPSYILLLLSDRDVREAVFRLTEAGFTRVKGINPEPRQMREGA